MRTLSLLRHAKSSWDDPVLDDFDRPLSERGRRDAPRMGAFMAERGLIPDLVLCSSARRTRETLDLVLAPLGRPDIAVTFSRDLYLAPAEALLNALRGCDAGRRHVLLVGHDPGLSELCAELAGSGPRDDLAAMASKFPTAGLAVVDIEAPDWRALGLGQGRLRLFMTPKRLAKAT